MDSDYTKKGLKHTEARSAVVMVLSNADEPLDVAGIKNEVGKLDLKVDQATVYRILNTFHEKGIIKRIEIGEGKYRYEISSDDHHHLICNSCGRIESIEDKYMNRIEEEILDKKKFLVKSHSLEFFGLCSACQN